MPTPKTESMSDRGETLKWELSVTLTGPFASRELSAAAFTSLLETSLAHGGLLKAVNLVLAEKTGKVTFFPTPLTETRIDLYPDSKPVVFQHRLRSGEVRTIQMRLSKVAVLLRSSGEGDV